MIIRPPTEGTNRKLNFGDQQVAAPAISPRRGIIRVLQTLLRFRDRVRFFFPSRLCCV